MDAYDPQLPGRITSGVGTSYYLVDIDPATCPQEPPPLTGPPGTCQNPVYTMPFLLGPGSHTIWYGSDDSAGNRETQKTKTIYADGDAPQEPARRAAEFYKRVLENLKNRRGNL